MKTKEQILVSFKKANKVRRLSIAKKAGYATAESYMDYLQGKIAVNTSVNVSEAVPGTYIKGEDVVKPTIHIVNILDASDSMSGTKFNNALSGINSEFSEMKQDTQVTYLGTLITFSYSSDIEIDLFKRNVNEIIPIKSRTRGMTALYDAIGVTLSKVKEAQGKDEKVLVNIFTDGQENDSRKWTAKTTQKLIKECEALGFTITFVGTSGDVAKMKVALSIDDSNTLVHNNTGAGVAESFRTRSAATKAYSKKVLNNEEVLTGFYKQTNQTL